MPSFRPLDRWLPWLAGALLVLPVLVARYPPMTDLPLFEGALALLRHWGDAAFVPPGVYELNLGRTTQLPFALALPLAYILSTAATCKVLVAASVASLVVGTARLARHSGGTPWVALLVAPVALGWLVFIGFLAYLVGTALWLLALPALDRWAEAPTARRGAIVSGIIVLLHLAHLASSACAVLTLVVLGLARGLDRRAPLRLAPAALALALAAADMRADRARASALAQAWSDRGMVWPPARVKLSMMGDYLFGAVGALPELLIVALVAAVVLLAVLAARAAPAAELPPERWSVRWRFAGLGLALLLCYLVSPFSVGAGAYFDARFLPPAWLIGVVALARLAPSSLPVRARLVAACVPLAWLTVVWPAFADSDREQRALGELYPHMHAGSAAGVLAAFDEGGQPYVHVSAGNRVLAERGGRALFSLVEAPRAPVLIRRQVRWEEAVSRLYPGGPAAICPPFDATRFRYLLLRIPASDVARAIVLGLAPDYRVEAASGAWLLLESTHATVALDAPDDAPPPGAPTLADKIGALSTAR